MLDISIITSDAPLRERAQRIRTFSVNYLMGRGNIGALRRLIEDYGKGSAVVFDPDLIVYNGGSVCVRSVGWDGERLNAKVSRIDGKGSETVDMLKLLQTSGSYDGAFALSHRTRGNKLADIEHPYHLTRADIAEIVRSMLIQCSRANG